VSVNKEDLSNCHAVAEDLFARAEEFETTITRVLGEHIYNPGSAGEVGANYLLSSLLEKRKKG
jgi:hypothetical protein